MTVGEIVENRPERFEFQHKDINYFVFLVLYDGELHVRTDKTEDI